MAYLGATVFVSVVVAEEVAGVGLSLAPLRCVNHVSKLFCINGSPETGDGQLGRGAASAPPSREEHVPRI